MTSDAQDIFFDANHAYLADGGAGVRTLRLLPTGELENIGTTFLLGSATRISRSRNRLLVTSDDGALFRVLSIADAENPALFAADSIFRLPIPRSGSEGIVGSVYVGDIAYVSIDGYGVVAVDLKDPERPVWVSGLVVEPTTGNLGDLVPYRARLLLATGADGILELVVE